MNKPLTLILALVHFSGCASLSCQEECSEKGMWCAGTYSGTDRGVAFGTGKPVSFTSSSEGNYCREPDPSEMGALSSYKAEADEKRSRNREKTLLVIGGVVLLGILGAVASPSSASSY